MDATDADSAAGTPAELARAFYAALDVGDAGRAAALLSEDATDDRDEEGPVTGARAIVTARLDAEAYPASRWTLEALITDGERVAVECVLTWGETGVGDREGERVSEWLTLRDGLIVAIRSYRGADEDDDGLILTDADFDWSLLETGDDEPL